MTGMAIFSMRVDEAFSHLFLVGLASILEDEFVGRTCSLRWIDRGHAEIETNDEIAVSCYAEIVLKHAKRWSDSFWLHSSGIYNSESERKVKDSGGSKESLLKHATLSPRQGTPDTREMWQRLQLDRRLAIDALQTPLDRRYIGALGEPSYWSGDMNAQGYTPDRGASRWEMVTRNRGQEFISGRLLPLAEAVSARSVEAIKKGLLGESIVDEVGHNSPDSRTPTGLRKPTLTDNAQAWCALFGVSAFSLGRSAAPRRANTASFFQLAREKPRAVLPVWRTWWTLDKYRSVVRSEPLTRAGVGAVMVKQTNVSDAERAASTQWLASKGVAGIELFEQNISDNASAPERWLKRGQFFEIRA
jgi:CRISPR-associated protein Csb3